MESLVVQCFLLLLCFLSIECAIVTNVTFARARGEHIFQSPNWPNSAPAFHDQIWQLAGPRDSQVVLSCDDIAILPSRNCAEGVLTIWNGNTQTNICNNVRPFQRESVGNRLTVRFRSLGNDRFRCTARVRQLLSPGDLGDLINGGSIDGTASPGTNCSCGWTNRRRIVGGTETGINEYPFVVSIKLANMDRGFCGGSIITRWHILTAAHCIDGLTDRRFQVLVGEHDVTTNSETSATVVLNVRSVILHERYDSEQMTNDIAILHLAQPITFNQFVGPVCLPSRRNDLVGRFVRVLGWGMTSTNGQFSNVLQQVDLKVINLSKCQERYTNFIDLVNPTQFCTFYPNRDSCQGDSGGPLIKHDSAINRYVQEGIVSFGKDCASNDPAVNIAVFAYNDWIQRTVARTAPGTNTCNRIN